MHEAGQQARLLPVAQTGSILLVEDDLDCRIVLAELLELSGYRVVPCGDAGTAMEAARRELPALVMLDLHLPGRDGVWLVHALREAGAPLSAVPIVLTTGSADAGEVAASLGVAHLEKPFDAGRLLELVKSLLPRAEEAAGR
jgi:DNA-binding response OmpR family regulator